MALSKKEKEKPILTYSKLTPHGNIHGYAVVSHVGSDGKGHCEDGTIRAKLNYKFGKEKSNFHMQHSRSKRSTSIETC